MRMILTFTPAGIERFFEETLERALDPTLSPPEPPEAVAARYAEAAPRYGMRFLTRAGGQRGDHPLPGRDRRRHGRPAVDDGQQLPVALGARVGAGGEAFGEPGAPGRVGRIVVRPGERRDDRCDERGDLRAGGLDPGHAGALALSRPRGWRRRPVRAGAPPPPARPRAARTCGGSSRGSRRLRAARRARPRPRSARASGRRAARVARTACAPRTRARCPGPRRPRPGTRRRSAAARRRTAGQAGASSASPLGRSLAGQPPSTPPAAAGAHGSARRAPARARRRRRGSRPRARARGVRRWRWKEVEGGGRG